VPIDNNSTVNGGVVQLQVDEAYVGQRLDNFLMRQYRRVPKTRIYRALRKGEVRVNGKRAKPEYRLQPQDRLRIPPLRQAEQSSATRAPTRWVELLENSIIYEDKGMLVINKPAGLAVHGGSGLGFGLIECLRQSRPQERSLELVHRLDRDTSGCLLIARKPAVLKDLHRQLRGGDVDKRYLALVAGRWPARQRRVEAPLKKNQLQSGERMVRISAEGKPSVTEFRVVERFKGATLVEASPITGRTHQIRVHALHQGFPLLGDDKYNSDQSQVLSRDLGLKRLFLHASSLSFHTLEGKRVQVEAELDPALDAILAKLRAL